MTNQLKSSLRDGRPQIGLWCSLANPFSAEVLAGSGADWLLIDGEHSPNDLRSIAAQLQAVSSYPLEPVVRIPVHDPVLIKQYLDIGARSLMIPNIRTVEEAERVVAATRYPPDGFRGYSVASRANRFGRVPNYHALAHEDICLVLQIEDAEGVANAVGIGAVEGVDNLFVGPSDLSANLGHMGNPGAEAVQAAIASVIASGHSSGILAPVEADAKRYLEQGATLVAVGGDVGLLAKNADALVGRFK